MKFFRNLLWAISLPFVAVYLLVLIGLARLTAKRYLNDKDSVDLYERYNKVMRIVNGILYLKNIKVEVHNTDFKIANKPMLYVGNHKSNGDALVLLKALHKRSMQCISFVAKVELKKSFLAPLFDLLDVVYIDRNNLRQIITTIPDQEALLKDTNRGLVIFPEGTRNFSDEFNEFKAGALTPAYSTKTTIQPFTILNSAGSFDSKDHNNKRYKKLWWNQKVIEIKFLDPINAVKYMNINKEKMIKQVQNNIKSTYDELKSTQTKSLKSKK